MVARWSFVLLLAAAMASGCSQSNLASGRADQRFDNPAEAMRFFVEQRAPFGQALPIERYLAAREHIRRMRSITQVDPNADPVEPTMPPRGRSGGAGGIRGWTAIGPGNLGGRTLALAINPLNPNVMYAGAASGGIWKTVDGGAN